MRAEFSKQCLLQHKEMLLNVEQFLQLFVYSREKDNYIIANLLNCHKYICVWKNTYQVTLVLVLSGACTLKTPRKNSVNNHYLIISFGDIYLLCIVLIRSHDFVKNIKLLNNKHNSCIFLFICLL